MISPNRTHKMRHENLSLSSLLVLRRVYRVFGIFVRFSFVYFTPHFTFAQFVPSVVGVRIKTSTLDTFAAFEEMCALHLMLAQTNADWVTNRANIYARCIGGGGDSGGCVCEIGSWLLSPILHSGCFIIHAPSQATVCDGNGSERGRHSTTVVWLSMYAAYERFGNIIHSLFRRNSAKTFRCFTAMNCEIWLMCILVLFVVVLV